MTAAGLRVVPVCQGELSVSGDPDIVLSCILGSCVATCLYDPRVRVGGMNHILLPGRRQEDIKHNRFGVCAMEALINEMMHLGARRHNLVAKIFGGASTFENGLGIGAANAAFVRDFLENEAIPVAAASLGGRQARRIRFFPQTGEAREFKTAEAMTAADGRTADSTGRALRRALPTGRPGEVELF